MDSQTQHTHIAEKLVAVMQACGYVQKDSENKQQKYKYVSAAAIADKVNEALVVNRLASMPKFTIVSEKEKATSQGAVWQLVTVSCTLYIVDADSGEFVTVTALGSGTDPGDKAVAKAQTMALKYAWIATLNIATGDDPEADHNTDKQDFTGDNRTHLINEINRLWGLLNWNPQQMPSYMEQRCNKPFAEITDADLQAMINEIGQYSNHLIGGA